MRIEKYGICLESITGNDLELIRYWRNQDHVRRNMEFQELISAEMQQNWFARLDTKSNLYFTILKDEEKIGVVNLKNIDQSLLQAEAGIFIGDTKHINTLSPLLATISIMEFAFETLKLKTLKAKIASDNYKVILFNESIGYFKCDRQEHEAFQYYETTHRHFINATQTIRHTLNKLNAKPTQLIFSEEEKATFGIG